jgi:glutathione S-transferase
MVRLFYAPGTCSLASMVAFEAAGISYEPVRIDLAGDRKELRDVYETAKVPAVDIGQHTIGETIAILTWAHSHKPSAGMLPNDPVELAHTLSLMSWLTSTLHILRRQYARPMAFCPDPAIQVALKEVALPRYIDALSSLEKRIAAIKTMSLGLQSYLFLFHVWAKSDAVTSAPLVNLNGLAEKTLGLTGTSVAVARHSVG